VTHLKFVVREDADSLVIAANSENGGFVEVWELREKSQPVHKLFQPKNLEPFKTVVNIEAQLAISFVNVRFLSFASSSHRFGNISRSIAASRQSQR